MKSFLSLLIFSFVVTDKRKPGSPPGHLPKNIEVLTHFGERGDFSPDNKSIAFMTKSFGDAMVIDQKTHNTPGLTCNVPAAFLRVMPVPLKKRVIFYRNPQQQYQMFKSKE
jgi:hypothetical protein